MIITKAGRDYLAAQYEHAVDRGLYIEAMRLHLAHIKRIPAELRHTLTTRTPSLATGLVTQHRHRLTWQHWTGQLTR